MRGIRAEGRGRAVPLALAFPRRTCFLLLFDLLAVVASFLPAIWVRRLLDPTLPLEAYLSLWPAAGLFPLAYALAGLYRVGIAPPEELRRLSHATSLVFIVLGTAAFMYKVGAVYSRGAFLLAWGLALVLVPLGRALLRELFARRPWWGEKAVVLGAGRTGALVVRALRRRPGLGLNPVALLDDEPEEAALKEFSQKGARCAILPAPGAKQGRLHELLERYGEIFPHLILVPDLLGLPSLWVSVRDFGGVMVLEVRGELLLPGPRLLKRTADVLLALLFGLALLPLMLLIALLIRLDSPGPVLYGQVRIGQGGRRFRAWKFRTMVVDADAKLKEYLEKHPELREEWERNQKLRHDPRVTRLGRFLRRTSLDELPQLWNVLRGEMSLVGPRPIVQDEVRKYGERFSLYAKVKPGMTGLWQVSGRNNTSYEERVGLDAYYVHNWSFWLDLYILARTLWVVISRDGAY